MSNIYELHSLWLVVSNLAFFVAAFVARRQQQPVVMWNALVVGTFSTLYHTSAYLLPLGNTARSTFNTLDWLTSLVAIAAAGYYIGWRLMGLLPKISTVAFIAFNLTWFAYSMCGSFELYTQMHAIFHVFGATIMMFLSYQGYLFQKNMKGNKKRTGFWIAVHKVQIKTPSDILLVVILYVYLRRKVKKFFRARRI